MGNTPSAYSEIEVSTDIMTASNHRLIQLLFGKCLFHIRNAKTHLNNKDIANRNKSIAGANDIITYLRDCLKSDDAKTKKFSDQLHDSYALIQNYLLNAMITNNIEYLELTYSMIETIKSGWDEIGHLSSEK